MIGGDKNCIIMFWAPSTSCSLCVVKSRANAPLAPFPRARMYSWCASRDRTRSIIKGGVCTGTSSKDRNACGKTGGAMNKGGYLARCRQQIAMAPLRRARGGHSQGTLGRGELRGRPKDARWLERRGLRKPVVSTKCVTGVRWSTWCQIRQQFLLGHLHGDQVRFTPVSDGAWVTL